VINESVVIDHWDNANADVRRMTRDTYIRSECANKRRKNEDKRFSAALAARISAIAREKQ